MSPLLRPEQCPRSPSNSIITPPTQRGTMLPIGWSGIAKPPAIDADGPRSRRPNAGLNPRHRPPPPSMTALPPLLNIHHVHSTPHPSSPHPMPSINGRFVTGCDNQGQEVIGETMGASEGRNMKKKREGETADNSKVNRNQRDRLSMRGQRSVCDITTCCTCVVDKFHLRQVTAYFRLSTTVFSKPEPKLSMRLL